MRKDKVIVAVGIVILLISAAGVYFYKPAEEKPFIATGEILNVLGGVMKDVPNAIEVADSSPFYALIATPLAVHYDKEGNREVIPLYVKNMTKPSKAIVRTERMVGRFVDLVVDGKKSPKEVSLELAEKYWGKSDLALIIKDDKEGYEVGLVATPIASYLSVPVIVTDKIDSSVIKTLSKLKVRYILICGNLSTDAFKSYKIETPDDALNITIDLVEEKFGKVGYITLANPIDAWPPRVLDKKVYNFGPEEIKAVSMNTQNVIKFLIRYLTGGVSWEFEIPKDYKYALIELDGYNHEVDDVDEFGDFVEFNVQPADKSFYIISAATYGDEAVRDAKGNIIEDRVHSEGVLYDYGGKKCVVSALGRWSLREKGKVSVRITVKKLEHPVYEMMKGLSTIAPYLTAYHHGILFARSSFAFTANDEVLTEKGERCSGFYLPGKNPKLVPMLNKHIHENIHIPLNKLLARLADIPYEKPSDLKTLTKYYREHPIYIALVGGTVALPRYLYQNPVEPIGDIDGDGKDDTASPNFGGGGTGSDSIYGDIDPVEYDWSCMAGDVYSKYPYIENIVGRVAAWDVQDASALLVRTFFYEEILANLEKWKNNFGNLFGGGIDFRKPLWIEFLNHLPILKQVLDLVNKYSMGFVNFAEGPWKYDTGFSEIMAKTIEDKIGRDLGFNVKTALHESAMLRGLSDDALEKLKHYNWWNWLTFPVSQVKELAGEGNVKGKEILENSNFIWITGHGCPYHFGLDSPDLVAGAFDGIILDAPRLWKTILKNTIIPHFVIGFWGPGGDLGRVGDYSPRAVSELNMGPSFVWLESCFCGRINGIYPRNAIGMAFIHAGVNALVASPIGSNIAGGYLPGKSHMWDTWIGTMERWKDWEKKVEQGIYPDLHFGMKMYYDMCQELKQNATIGKAFRDAKNKYLPEDADWKLWWSPPLSASQHGGDEEGYGTHMPAKYVTFYEYCLYGDPAFNPYVPGEAS